MVAEDVRFALVKVAEHVAAVLALMTISLVTSVNSCTQVGASGICFAFAAVLWSKAWQLKSRCLQHTHGAFEPPPPPHPTPPQLNK